MQDINGGKPAAVTPEIGEQWFAISPDGKSVAAMAPDRSLQIWPLSGGTPIPVRVLSTGDRPISWSADGRAIYLYQPGMVCKLFRLDLRSCRRELWKEIAPFEAPGTSYVWAPLITPDAKFYAYTNIRAVSSLYVIDGLK